MNECEHFHLERLSRATTFLCILSHLDQVASWSLFSYRHLLQLALFAAPFDSHPLFRRLHRLTQRVRAAKVRGGALLNLIQGCMRAEGCVRPESHSHLTFHTHRIAPQPLPTPFSLFFFLSALSTISALFLPLFLSLCSLRSICSISFSLSFSLLSPLYLISLPSLPPTHPLHPLSLPPTPVTRPVPLSTNSYCVRPPLPTWPCSSTGSTAVASPTPTTNSAFTNAWICNAPAAAHRTASVGAVRPPTRSRSPRPHRHRHPHSNSSSSSSSMAVAAAAADCCPTRIGTRGTHCANSTCGRRSRAWPIRCVCAWRGSHLEFFVCPMQHCICLNSLICKCVPNACSNTLK
jgi:hypothetical protein